MHISFLHCNVGMNALRHWRSFRETVNWGFLSKEIFLSRQFHLSLLAGFLVGLIHIIVMSSWLSSLWPLHSCLISSIQISSSHWFTVIHGRLLLASPHEEDHQWVGWDEEKLGLHENWKKTRGMWGEKKWKDCEQTRRIREWREGRREEEEGFEFSVVAALRFSWNCRRGKIERKFHFHCSKVLNYF